MTTFEKSELFKLIRKGTRECLENAFNIIDSLSEEQVKLRSEKDRSTYLHLMVNSAHKVRENCDSLTPLVPIIYKLCLKGLTVNAQNEHGNTALHLACIRPNVEELCEHLIRNGADPCILSQKGCRVIHTIKGHKCHIVKGQESAKSGIWNAVEKEDVWLTEKLLKTWCRVNIRKNRGLKEVCDETGSMHVLKLLDKYEKTNELACVAFSCDAEKTRELIKAGGVDLDQKDEACDCPKPLVVSVQELGEVAAPVVAVLEEMGMDPGQYDVALAKRQEAFEDCEFYRLVEAGTEDSLTQALDLVYELDVTLTSHRPHTMGWNYLHYVVDRYNKLKEENEEVARILIRILYKLVLAGIDVNLRDASGETPLIKASAKLDQALMTHLVRVGGDPGLTAVDGRAVNEEVYEDKGKLVFDKRYRLKDFPGLWVAIQTDDQEKAERWLKSWARVNTRKGDRRMIDIASALGRTEIVKMLKRCEHINEFVCATFACDLKAMMHLLSLGQGEKKVNSIDDFFHVGFTWDRHAEFLPRPIIINAMEICTPEVVDFMLKFNADLSKEYEESSPCGPISFWAFRDHIDNNNALVVAKHADVSLQDELGATMLHKAIQKKRHEGKKEIVSVLLDRGVNIAARDVEGCTARDYISIHDMEHEQELKQIIDEYILELVSNDQHYKLENLIIESYDHIVDIRGTKKNKNVREIAELKELKEMKALIGEDSTNAAYEQYKADICRLHKAAKQGDYETITKLAGEKRCAWSKDLAGRTLLHTAVLYEHADICTYLVENHGSHLINATDNLLRTPLHYCVCLKEREKIWPILQDGGADPNLIDGNSMSVYDYVRELDTPTPMKERPRGRRGRNYRPADIIQAERQMDYSSKPARFELRTALLKMVKTASLSEVTAVTASFPIVDLGKDDCDLEVLQVCVEGQREEVVKHLIEKCGARHDAMLKVLNNVEEEQISLADYATKHNMSGLVDYIKARGEGGEQEEQCQEPQQEQLS